MKRKRKIVPLTVQEEFAWKTSTLDYLRKLISKTFPAELADDLMKPQSLLPYKQFEGDFILMPNTYVDRAFYLKKGLAKLYYYNQDGGLVLLHIWDADSIVVLFRKFKSNEKNRKYYIELMEDSELVAISNETMSLIYQAHPYAQELTDEILNRMQMREELHTEILQMTDKKGRYRRLKELFPEFLLDEVWRLTNEEICSFINISEKTLTDARKIYDN